MMRNGSKDAPSERGNEEKVRSYRTSYVENGVVRGKEGKKENLMREDCRVGIS